MKLANRVQTLTPSATLAITAKAKALKEAGHDVIGLGAGEPDFDTPDYIIDAAEKAMRQGLTRYTPAGGILPLREAIAAKMLRDHQLNYETDQIIVTTGAKHALYTLFQVILNKGDEVIVPSPYWVSYPEQIKLAEGTPVFVRGEETNQFKLTAAQLESAITDKTRAVIINSPSNPTGMMYSKEELLALGEVCIKHNIIIVSDEIYEKLLYTDREHVSIASLSEQLQKQTVVINGVSKSHAMTGWRIGYACGRKTIIKAMTNLASHSTSNPTTISQYAALAAYTENESTLKQMVASFSERLDYTYELITQLPGVTCVKPQGAFYLFPNVKEAITMTGFEDVGAFATALLEEEQVALVPGTGFGAPDNVRLSYVIEPDQLAEAMRRIDQFIKRHTEI
ncbi:aspartate aminotransferase [Streptohalobacillus salinus]|uniref:Aminotransferase n=1 Tax=Streptohalobacillus salinus TaxID=621096 RepID=A0A2V3WF40_9BACI|nr:pyridoxal phosphate-dependent aminotransferase [Streptohalobacillus salinus]PXW91748.1 aspartate aminotransferase [Streptohalobacillus salinus]